MSDEREHSRAQKRARRSGAKPEGDDVPQKSPEGDGTLLKGPEGDGTLLKGPEGDGTLLKGPEGPDSYVGPDSIVHGHRPAELDDPDRRAPDLAVESPVARERDGGALVPPARPGVTFKLPRFEGPLDLLLHLIKRDEVDIHDIPIAHITRQYLQYIELMRMLDLEVAGEFLVMAATLMRIKAKMLLPLPSTTEEEDEGDPREELVQRLLEYRLYKEAAVGLGEGEGVRRTLHERGNPPTEDDAGPLPLAPATLFDLLGALQRVMARRTEQPVYSVETEGFDIEEMMSLLARTVAEEGQVRFSDVMRRARVRMEIIVSFMALLELIKLGTVTCVQEANFADILILPRLQERVGPDATGTPALGR